MLITNVDNPRNTHGLNTMRKTVGMIPASSVTAPRPSMPFLSMICAAALVRTVNRMSGI